MFLKKIRKGRFKNIFKRIYKSFLYRINRKAALAYKKFGYIRIKLFFIKIIPLKWRLNFIEPIDIRYISNNELKKKLKIKSKPELGYLFIELTSKGKNIRKNLEKAGWCIAAQKHKKFNYQFLFNTIKSLNLESDTIQFLFNFITNPFFYYGAINEAEDLQKSLKLLYDKKLNKNPSLENEILHFTAIGHISLAFFLIQAIKAKLVDPTKTPISLVYDPENISNREYANLVSELCPEFGIEIIHPSKLNDSKIESNLELWPSNSKKKYLHARHFYGQAYNQLDRSENLFFLKPKKHHIEIANSILKEFSLDTKIWFVGMHLRYANDERGLRNPSPHIFQKTIDYIKQKGGSTILVGSKPNKIYDSLNSVIDTTKLNLTQYERECLGIYIWSRSKFFVGSLSGGTFPPTTFGVPTIWLDMYPTSCLRPPNKEDICLPKRVFYETENRYLSFEEANSERHYYSQSENAEVAKENGYRIESVSYDLVEEVLEEMISKIIFKKNSKTKISQNENFSKVQIGSKIITKNL